MSHIKHNMIERRDIDLSITKEELVSKLLKSYHIDSPTPELIASLNVSLSDGILRIKGVHESVMAEITPEYNDNIIAKQIDSPTTNIEPKKIPVWAYVFDPANGKFSEKPIPFKGNEEIPMGSKILPRNSYRYWIDFSQNPTGLCSTRGAIQYKFGKTYFIADIEKDLDSSGDIIIGRPYAVSLANEKSAQHSYQIRKITKKQPNQKTEVVVLNEGLTLPVAVVSLGYAFIGGPDEI